MTRYLSNETTVRSLLAGVSFAALLTLPGVAMAQSTPAADDSNGGLEEIVVTAQKQEQNLQNVPVAVTAVTVEQIENRQLHTFNDLKGIAPNLSAVHSSSGSDPIITMRGIVGGNATNGVDTAIAMYIDGIYLARTTGSSFDVADLERVEVLRGPQGTLYGRNSTGGAINFITTNPKDKLSGRIEGTVGNFNRWRVKARLDSGKIGPLSVSLSYLHDEERGWTRNLNAGLVRNFSAITPYIQGDRKAVDWLGGHKTDAGFVAVRLQPEGSSVTVDYKFDISKSIRTNEAQQIIFDGGLGIPATLVSTSVLDTVAMPYTTPEELKSFGHSLTVQADLGGGFKIKSLAGYRGSTDTYTNSVAGSGGIVPNAGEFAITNIAAYEKTRQFSQENQITYKSQSFDAIIGTYYFHETTTSTAPVYIFQFVPFILPNKATLAPAVDGDVTSHNQSVSAYAQLTAHASDRIDITGGIRYTKDNRSSTERGSFFGVARKSFDQDFSHTDWTAVVNFRATDDITVYAKASSGYLSGGVFAGIPFNPETMVQYEAGIKSQFLDKHLRINLSGYHSDNKSLQVAGFFNTANYQVRNVAKAKVDGFEAEITALPVRGLTLNANYGYTNFRYIDDAAKTLQNSGIVNPAYRPKHTLSFNANYKFAEFGGGIKPSFDLNASYTGDQFLAGGGESVLSNGKNIIAKNASWNVDARFTLSEISLGGARLKASVWTKNLFDDRSLVNATDATGGFVINGQFRRPRTFGLDLGVEF